MRRKENAHIPHTKYGLHILKKIADNTYAQNAHKSYFPVTQLTKGPQINVAIVITNSSIKC